MLCFSLISAIETDLRSIITDEIPNNYEDYIPNDVIKVARERYADYNKDLFSKDVKIIDLLDYIDFYDLSKILNKIIDIQTFSSKDEIKEISKSLQDLTPCRNRVCHSRPLEQGDTSTLLDFANRLIKLGGMHEWKNINVALNNINNPSFALSLEIPPFWKITQKSVSNNLPLTEFDDTGFIGRENDRKAINRLIFSNTKVISIVGEGGVGKTALAQRCLYDTLEICESGEDNANFDIIVWVSLKANRLTVSGSSVIKDAISTCSGLLHDIALNLSGIKNNSIEEDLKEILEYMEQFKVLLCIDNLETISSSDVRDFLANIPNNSKVLITTRIGLGEIEYRYKLDKLDDNTSINLMRGISKLLNVERVYKKNNNSLRELCKCLYNNPLLIKWYVFAVAAGSTNSELINKNTKNFKEALTFCFENLYDQLSSIEKEAISVIACVRRPLSTVELRFFLSGYDEIKIEEALHQLHNSSMLISSDEKTSDTGLCYTLTGVAEEYINSIRPVSNEFYKKVKDKTKELRNILEQERIQKSHYNYDLNVIYWNTPDERICSTFLKKALTYAKAGDSVNALENVKKAKQLMPSFSECYRIHGYIIKESSPFSAGIEIKKAIDLNSKSVISKYAYSQFLVAEDEIELANNQIDEALLLDENDIALRTWKAWVLTLMGDYISAKKLYEEIIPQQALRHRKFRISTYDQASSCYRRMAESYIRDQDYTEAKKSLCRAYEIIEQAVNSNDYDHGSMNKLIDILEQSIVLKNKSSDDEILNEVIIFIEANYSYLNVKSMQELKKGLESISRYSDDILGKRIDKILGSIITGGSERIIGTIDNVISNERGASYGFLVGMNDVRYFFHRSELNPNDILDNGKDIGNVSFIPGKNEKGMAAYSIRMIN